jgi:hypothetical protein
VRGRVRAAGRGLRRKDSPRTCGIRWVQRDSWAASLPRLGFLAVLWWASRALLICLVDRVSCFRDHVESAKIKRKSARRIQTLDHENAKTRRNTARFNRERDSFKGVARPTLPSYPRCISLDRHFARSRCLIQCPCGGASGSGTRARCGRCCGRRSGGRIRRRCFRRVGRARGSGRGRPAETGGARSGS